MVQLAVQQTQTTHCFKNTLNMCTEKMLQENGVSTNPNPHLDSVIPVFLIPVLLFNLLFLLSFTVQWPPPDSSVFILNILPLSLINTAP